LSENFFICPKTFLFVQKLFYLSENFFICPKTFLFVRKLFICPKTFRPKWKRAEPAPDQLPDAGENPLHQDGVDFVSRILGRARKVGKLRLERRNEDGRQEFDPETDVMIFKYFRRKNIGEKIGIFLLKTELNY
jgi:hypothetical protein